MEIKKNILAVILLFGAGFHCSGEDVVTRSSDGLVVLYNFCETDGPVIREASEGLLGTDLHTSDMRMVQRQPGRLKVHGETSIHTQRGVGSAINSRIRSSQALTIEAWITPASLNQSGPARIISLSNSSSSRNVTLGQDGDSIDVRLRTSKTSGNGIPSVSTKAGTLSTRQVHVTYTRDRAGSARIYLDGELKASARINGDLDGWDLTFPLILANESGGGRSWKGTYHMVAVYNRALSRDEVFRHFQAGAEAADTPVESLYTHSESDRYFQNEVAPILANHCLECHDAATNKGGLDLSRKDTAMAGSKNGPVIIPGKAQESELWLSVHHDEMPDERTLLVQSEKDVIRKWINDGAHWSLDLIDPILYLSHSGVHESLVRRLTAGEYIRAVYSATGVDIAREALDQLPQDLRADGFRNTAYNLNVDLKHIRAYASLAQVVVSRMDVRDFAGQFTRRLKFTDNDMGALINQVGLHILRRPLKQEELFAYRGITTSVAAAGGTYEEALSLVLEAMLQSPGFLYRIESEVGDGSEWPTGSYEMASRLSFALWGASPDRDMLTAAENGELYDSNYLNSLIDRMLMDPRCVDRSMEFFDQWLNLSRLGSMQPSRDLYPDWDDSLADDMRAETLSYLREIVWEKRLPMNAIFNQRFTWVTPALARHYGLDGVAGDGGLRRVEFPAGSRRGGILTHGSVLTVGGDEASMVARGLFIMNQVLRGVVKDPPPCVNTTPRPTAAGQTQRTMAMERLEDASCAGCHKKFEPLAFGLEKFDGLGRFSEVDHHGNRLREDGQILMPGTSNPQLYDTSSELMDILANQDRVTGTMVWKLAQFVMGRPLTAEDAPHIEDIITHPAASSGTYQDIMKSILLSDLTRTIKTEIRN